MVEIINQGPLEMDGTLNISLSLQAAYKGLKFLHIIPKQTIFWQIFMMILS
jgi:hypothetical protein